MLDYAEAVRERYAVGERAGEAAERGAVVAADQQQVLTPLEDASIMGTPTADQTSIMCYQISGECTVDGQPITGAGGERLPERPAAPTRPRGLADRQPLPERVTTVGGEQRPGDRQVAGRIADAARPKVDDGR